MLGRERWKRDSVRLVEQQRRVPVDRRIGCSTIGGCRKNMKRRTVVLSCVFGFVAVSLYLLRIVTLSNRADWGAVVGVGLVVGTLLFTLLTVWGAVVRERRRLTGGWCVYGAVLQGAGYNPGRKVSAANKDIWLHSRTVWNGYLHDGADCPV